MLAQLLLVLSVELTGLPSITNNELSLSSPQRTDSLSSGQDSHLLSRMLRLQVLSLLSTGRPSIIKSRVSMGSLVQLRPSLSVLQVQTSISYQQAVSIPSIFQMPLLQHVDSSLLVLRHSLERRLFLLLAYLMGK